MTLIARPTTQQHYDSVKALLASLPASVTVMSPGEARNLAADLSARLVLLTVERVYDEPLRLEGVSSRETRRIAVRSVGDEDNANRVADLVRDALEYAVVTCAGRMSTRIRSETSSTAEPVDKGLYAADATYLYVI